VALEAFAQPVNQLKINIDSHTERIQSKASVSVSGAGAAGCDMRMRCDADD